MSTKLILTDFYFKMIIILSVPVPTDNVLIQAQGLLIFKYFEHEQLKYMLVFLGTLGEAHTEKHQHNVHREEHPSCAHAHNP